MKIITISEYYTPKLCADNPSSLFIYGDNLEKTGKGGQACIRHCSNTHGIPTKRKPSSGDDAYFSDDDFEANKEAILNEMESVWNYARANYGAIIFPKEGLGTGLAELKERAPKTWGFLCAKLTEMFGFDNEKGEIVE